MECCPAGCAKRTCQINVLVNNAGSAASHRYWNTRAGCIPCVSNRIILPSLVGFEETVIKATDNVDFSIGAIVGYGGEETSCRHWGACNPTIGSNIVNVSGVEDIRAGIEAAKNIDLIDVGRVSRARV